MPKSTQFQPNSSLKKVFAYPFKTNTIERIAQVFQWENRLVAYEESTGLWWGALDGQHGPSAEQFWQWCVANGRVGRLFSPHRGIVSYNKGARLSVAPFLSHVLVANGNSGIARLDDESKWYSFPPQPPLSIANWLARKPTIWDLGFHTKFVRGALNAIYEEAMLARLPVSTQLMWRQGTNAHPLRLLAAALECGWMDIDSLQDTLTLQQFWSIVLRNRFRLGPPALDNGKRNQQLEKLLKGPEFKSKGKLIINRHSGWRRKMYFCFVLRDGPFTVRVPIEATNDSAHERFETRLLLRDWLIQVFPAKEVESWFSI